MGLKQLLTNSESAKTALSLKSGIFTPLTSFAISFQRTQLKPASDTNATAPTQNARSETTQIEMIKRLLSQL